MSNITAPYRYDFVGSFLRPQKLKDAKADFKAGKMTREELTAVEDEAIAASHSFALSGSLSHIPIYISTGA